MKPLRSLAILCLTGLLCAPLAAAELERVDSADFVHGLEFEDDGVPPSEEGGLFEEGGDGWAEPGNWTQDAETPPTYSIANGLLTYDTTGLGQGGGLFFSIDQADGASAWSNEVDGTVSWTFELQLRATGPADGEESAPDAGTAIWIAAGSGRRSVVIVDVNEVRWGVGAGGEVVHTGDNSTEFVTIRIARDLESGWVFVWRNGELVVRDPDGTANDGRRAVFIIDYGSTSEAAGELEYVRWETGGAFAPEGDAGDDTAPAPPSGLTGEAEDGRVLLDWADNEDADLFCYAVGRATSAGGPYSVIASGVLPSAYEDTSVVNGTTYYYTITAFDGTGNESGISNEASATPDAGLDVTPPAAPIDLIATPQAGGTIFLDWLDNAEGDLASYTIYRGPTAGGPYDVLEEGVTESELADEDAESLVRYFYVVTAVDLANNESADSNEASAAVTVALGDEIERDAADFGHKLLFDEDGVLPPDEGVLDGWTLDAFNTGPGAVAPALDVAGGVLSFETALAGQWSIVNNGGAWTTEVDPSTSYTFETRLRVTASAGTNPGATLWLANGLHRVIVRVDTNNVSTFSGISLHDGDNSSTFVTIRIVYDAPTDTYHVWRDGALIGSSLGNDGGAANGRRAVFLLDCCSSVQATGEIDYVCWDATGAFLPPVDGGDVTPPAAPTGLTAEAEDSRIHLSWNANTEDVFSSYELGRSETSGGPYERVYLGGAKSFIDEGLTNGVEYFYALSAVDVNRNASDLSDEVSATPTEGLDITPPAALQTLVGRPTIAGEVSLTWEVSVDIDATTYNLSRSETAGGPHEIIAEGIPLLETAYVDDAVSSGTTYFYVVTVLDLAGNESEPSNEVAVTPESFDGFEERAASEFPHKLLFEEDGVLPSVEGAADGWAEDAVWNIDGEVAPRLSVSDGLLRFESDLPGQQAITMQAGSAWANEVTPASSYTFEARVRVIESNAPNPGIVLWITNGATRIILRVDAQQTVTWSGLVLSEEDNTSDFVDIRIAYHAPTDLYYIWRNEELIGDGVPNDGNANGGRTAVFLIDCCSSSQVEGEFDSICWDATGAYAPGDDIIDPPRPEFFRGDTDDNGTLQLTDGVFVFNFLFTGGRDTTCKETMDTNNDGNIDLTDGVIVLNHLFIGGNAPHDPGPPSVGACGTDPDEPGSRGDLGCESYNSCP